MEKIFYILCLVCALASLDFMHFRFVIISQTQTDLPENTKHLVVLTGGAERIEAGLAAAERPHVKSVFITGIHANTTAAEIFARAPNLSSVAKQKTTLDYTAQTTRENAQQTRLWAKQENIKHITLLTAHYHIPRALLHFNAYAPTLIVTPFPLYRPKTSTQFFLREYSKYRAATIEYALK